ncbi:MAG: glycosyltransferase family 1 protein [bacterium]|nr:glycosyltransferase family 1 protein [bacterium]
MEQYPVRVLHVVGSMHPGGMENFIMNLYRNIDRNRVQFDFVVHADGDAAYEREIREMGGTMYRLPRLTSHPAANLKGLYRIVKNGHYKVVIRHTPNALVAPQVYAAARAGAFSICHSHNTTDPKKLLHHIGKVLMKHGKIGRFACSKDAGTWMFGNRDCVVVHNAIDIDRFCFSQEKRVRIRTEFEWKDRHIYGHVGNFIGSKNHAFLLAVYREIARIDDCAAFVCIGDGELKEQICQEAERMEIRDRIFFTGIRHDVDAFLSAMDVLVFPSLFEGLPLTLIEAQAAGLPCLVSEAVDKGVEVANGLVSWKSLDETPQAWAEKAVSLAGGDAGDGNAAGQTGVCQQDALTPGRICRRDAIAGAGYDIRTLAKWYEEYLTGKAKGKMKQET